MVPDTRLADTRFADTRSPDVRSFPSTGIGGQGRFGSGRRAAPGASLTLAAGGVLLCLGGGCAAQAERGLVSGSVITRDGQPLSGVRVTFLPDPARATSGMHASGVTDAEGRFELTYRGELGGAGAVPGWHKVVIADYAAENSREERRGFRPRIPSRYRLASTTPLQANILPGQQTVHFEIDGG